MLRRSDRTPWSKTTPPLGGSPCANHPRSSSLSSVRNSTGSACRSSGGGPIGWVAGAIKTPSVHHTAANATSSAAAPASRLHAGILCRRRSCTRSHGSCEGATTATRERGGNRNGKLGEVDRPDAPGTLAAHHDVGLREEDPPVLDRRCRIDPSQHEGRAGHAGE